MHILLKSKLLSTLLITTSIVLNVKQIARHSPANSRSSNHNRCLVLQPQLLLRLARMKDQPETILVLSFQNTFFQIPLQLNKRVKIVNEPVYEHRSTHRRSLALLEPGLCRLTPQETHRGRGQWVWFRPIDLGPHNYRFKFRK